MPDRGTICRDGREVAIRDLAFARTLGIAMVFQELSLAPDLDIIDNMFLGREQSARLPGFVDRRSEETACRAVLDRLGLTLDPRQRVRHLGMAQKQMLEIGKALSQQPTVLILDEPTASLTRREIEQLFALIRWLREAGTAILYVTHHLREVLEIGDDVSIMRDGKIVADLEVTGETTEDELIELLIGGAPSRQVAASVACARAPLLEVTSLHTKSCSGVSFHIGEGEIVGLYGVVGCGREEIGRAVVGLHPVHGGHIALAGARYAARDPADALASGVGFLPSDRKQEGILPNRPIRENLMLSNLRAVTRGGLLRQRFERRGGRTARRARRQIWFGGGFITTLSGGNQQRVLFERAFSARPKLLILEDPTAGIDIGAKRDLYRRIRGHARKGMGLSMDVKRSYRDTHTVRSGLCYVRWTYRDRDRGAKPRRRATSSRCRPWPRRSSKTGMASAAVENAALRLGPYRMIARFGLPLLVVAIAVVTGIREPHFWSIANAQNLARQLAPLQILVIGQFFAILSGGLDLSVASVMACSGVLGVLALPYAGLSAGSRHDLDRPVVWALQRCTDRRLFGFAVHRHPGHALSRERLVAVAHRRPATLRRAGFAGGYSRIRRGVRRSGFQHHRVCGDATAAPLCCEARYLAVTSTPLDPANLRRGIPAFASATSGWRSTQ